MVKEQENFGNGSWWEEIKRKQYCAAKPQKRLVLQGPPGCGKGTQAPQIQQEQCICRLSTGDILRSLMSDDSELGKKLQNTINHGELVSDEIIIQIIKEAIKSPSCYKGFVLDGFPRTLRQAELLDEFLREQNKKLDGVLSFQVNDDELIDRIQGRLVHPKSGRSYHIHLNPPKVPGKDDITGENLVHRVDDTCEILQYRLQQYNTSTAPLLQYYKQKDLLHIINGNQPIDQVSKQIVNVLKSV